MQAGGQTKETAPKRGCSTPEGAVGDPAAWEPPNSARERQGVQLRGGETGLRKGMAGRSKATLKRLVLPAAKNQHCCAT